jgi:hypothetical protein
MRAMCFAVTLLLLTHLSLARLSVAQEGSAPVAPQAAAKSAEKAERWVSLFDGKTLNGWKVMGCEAVVEEGAILLKSGNGVVRSDRTYKDYILEVEWKALQADKWDSGVFIRCSDPPAGKPWPKLYQSNLQKGQEGNIADLKEARSTGLTKEGQWNHFRLTVVGRTVKLDINGQPAWKADGLESPSGYIALQSEVPKGGQFLFRNIRIQELDGGQ